MGGIINKNTAFYNRGELSGGCGRRRTAFERFRGIAARTSFADAKLAGNGVWGNAAKY
ncbi:MAG: hypothetical protein ACTTKL_01840 [Treponema sp.]